MSWDTNVRLGQLSSEGNLLARGTVATLNGLASFLVHDNSSSRDFRLQLMGSVVSGS